MTGGVLVTSVGRRVQLLVAMRAAMQDRGWTGPLVTTDGSNLAPGSFFSDHHASVPPIDSSDYLHNLEDICRKYSIRLVVPTIDTELPLLAEARSHFSSLGITIAISSPSAIAVASDKVATAQFLNSRGLPTPRTIPCGQAIAQFTALDAPMLVKPIRGSSSKGVRVICSLSELRAIDDSDSTLVQDFIEGDEYTVSSFVDGSGASLAEIPRLRIEVRAGEVSKGRTTRHPQIEDLVKAVVESLPGLYGPLNVQVIDGPAGPQVLELNPRFGGGDPLAWAAGAQIPRWLLEDVEVPGSVARYNQWLGDVLMTRYDQAVFAFPNGSHHVG